MVHLSKSIGFNMSSKGQHKKFKTVNLSGPINIIIPIDGPEGVDATNDEHRCFEVDTTGTTYQDQDAMPALEKLDLTSSIVNASSFCPYVAGNDIFLKTSDEGTPIKALILKCFQATLSCVMVIRFIEPPIFNGTSKCILKLLDRRFSTQAREDLELTSWTPELEQQFQDFIRDGDAEEFFSYWDAEKEFDHGWSAFYVANHGKWSAAKWEAYIQWQTIDLYETEKKAYQLMAALQGVAVPKMLGEVVLDLSAEATKVNSDEELDEDAKSTTSDDKNDNPSVSIIPGLLLQFVDGFELTDLHEHLPREQWQSVVDSSITTLRQIQACGILNYDANTRNFIVDPTSHKAMMVDFGITKFREDVDSDREWDEMQAYKDEEFLVAMAIQHRLKTLTGNTIVYKPTERHWRLMYRYNQEGGENEGGTKEEEEYVASRLDVVY
ncbi:hypothetical protein KCU95_g13549, partial [Aureobasidium melanogenum]